MKKIRLIMCLTMALTILMGSVLSVSASENMEKEDNIFYDGLSRDENGKYTYFVKYYTGAYGSGGNGYIREAEFVTTSPVACYMVEDLTSTLGCVKYAMADGIKTDGTLNMTGHTFVMSNETYVDSEMSVIWSKEDTFTLSSMQVFSDKDGYIFTTAPLFMTEQSAKNYIETMDDSGAINKQPLTDEEMIFNSDIPTPILVFDNDGGLGFQFNNASEDFYIEMKGRWWSVDDITLFKKNLIWKYSYESLIKNDLSTWISNTSCVSSENEHDLSDYGKESFENLLTLYPVDERNYSGGSNALGNYFSGYNDAMTTLKMLLNEKTSSYNGCEVYVRYYMIDNNGNYYYGKWCHWLGNLANQEESSGSVLDDENIYKGQQSENGITDDDMEIIESSGNSRNDPDLKEEIYGEYESPITGISSSEFSAYFKQAIDIIKGLGGMLGEFPSLVGQIASYLPPWVIACMGVGIVFVIILRIVGR